MPLVAVFSSYREPPSEQVARDLVAQRYTQRVFRPVGAHTYDEARMIVQEAQRQGVTEVIAITSAYHAWRAWLTCIKVLEEVGADRTIHITVQATASPWTVDATEAAKITAYQAQGHVASLADARAYRDWWATSCAT